jgi:hypothetical protein
MMLAHIYGVPVEEWFGAVAVYGGGVALAVRACVRRFSRH